jgi:hypothetical protein
MTNIPRISSRQDLKRLVALTMISSFFFTSVIGVHTTLAVQKTESELIAQANNAVAAAEAALDNAEAKEQEASARLSELQEFSTFKEPDINSLSNIRRLATTVSSMFDATAEKKTLQEQLADAQTKVVAALKPLNDAKTDLDKATSTPGIEAAKTRVNNQIADVKARLDAKLEKDTALTGLVTNLNTALAAVYPAVAKLAKAADDRLAPFKQNITEPTDLLNLFQNKGGDIPRLIQFDLDLQESWTNLSAQLKTVVSDHDTKVTPADTAVKGLHASVATVASNLNAQIAILAKYAQTREAAVLATSTLFKSDPAAHDKEALEAIKEGQRIADALDKINRIADSISAQADSAGTAGFDKPKTQAAQKDLTTNLNSLRLRATAFQELLSGDRSTWVTEKFRLYYFTDIPRLVRTLNPAATLVGGDAEARRRAEDRLDKLRAAEDAQSEANAAVSGLKRRVRNIQQQLQQANDELETANFLSQAAANRDAELNRRPAADVSAERKALSLQEKNKREQDRAAAQERADKLNDEHTGLMAALKEAESQLETAQAAFERASNATIRAAQVESAAFANVRDNAPFWFGLADATSSDPAKRVEITSSTSGENAIFVRGRREDVVKVQDIIAELDEPAPQARMTLWKMELNSDATEKGAEKFNKALGIVEQELAATRANIATTLTLLLNAVNTEAEAASRAAPGPSPLRKDCFERGLYTRYFQPNPAALPTTPAQTNVTGRYQRLGRYSLYAPEVRRELGIEFIDELGFDNPKQFGLKDPGSATTLNEALIVLLLTDRDHRQNIITNFRNGLRQFDTDPNQPTQFRRLEAMLTDPAPRSPTDLETTRQQQELIYAIRGSLLKHLVGRITRLQGRVADFQFLHKKRQGWVPKRGETPKELQDLTPTEEDALYTCLQEKLPIIFDTIHDEFPISAVDVISGQITLDDPGDGTIALQTPKGRKVYNLRPSPARVAAADGMLDVYTKAFEDDIDRVFVQPMLGRLRTRMKKTGIGFGVIQRTSVLATNRLIARVDPRATAELSVGEETNLIQGLQSISQITLAAQTGNILGGLAALKSSANEKDAAEIYGITSGSAFQVTPIFDPTGQALRFKFDFVDTTLVRDPRGTTNPRIPRVERHTVNTEVQLANLEIREVSRFESDAKVGIPTTYWGGLPLVKDIPGIRAVPLIGWFVRRKGSNAIAQRSLIFAQTTMSPTIGDILDLSETSLQRR